MKRVTTLIVLLFFAIISNAQEKSYLVRNVTINELGPFVGRYIDKATSSAVQNEYLLSQKLYHFTEKGKMLRYLDENASFGLHFQGSKFYVNPLNLCFDLDIGYAWTYNLVGTSTDNFRMWAGGAINDRVDLKVFSNTIPTLSNFLYASGDVALSWRFDKAAFTTFVKLPLLTMVTRPDYAIIGANVTHKSDISPWLDYYTTKFRGLGGLSFDIGISWINKKNKPCRVSYRWSYMSAGCATVWNFDEATHSLTIAVGIKESKR